MTSLESVKTARTSELVAIVAAFVTRVALREHGIAAGNAETDMDAAKLADTAMREIDIRTGASVPHECCGGPHDNACIVAIRRKLPRKP